MSEFTNTLSEVFDLFGTIESKPMFGGHGVYHDGLMFALVADDELYLKADAQSVSIFTDLGLLPFKFVKAGKTMSMSYYQAPEFIFDDPESAREWAHRAYDAALRNQKPKRK